MHAPVKDRASSPHRCLTSAPTCTTDTCGCLLKAKTAALLPPSAGDALLPQAGSTSRLQVRAAPHQRRRIASLAGRPGAPFARPRPVRWPSTHEMTLAWPCMCEGTLWAYYDALSTAIISPAPLTCREAWRSPRAASLRAPSACSRDTRHCTSRCRPMCTAEELDRVRAGMRYGAPQVSSTLA